MSKPTLAERLQEIEQTKIERRWRRLGTSEPRAPAESLADLAPRVAARAEVAVALVKQQLLAGRPEVANAAAREALVQITEARQLLGGLAAEHEWQLELALAELAELRVLSAGAL